MQTALTTRYLHKFSYSNSYSKQNLDEWETLQIKCQIGDLVFMAHLQFTLVIYST